MKKFFLFSILFIGIFAFLAYKIDWWFPFANETLEKQYADKLICEKTYWLSSSEVVLENCKNKKELFKSDKINFNFLSGDLRIKNIWLKIPETGSQSNSTKIPHIPAQIKKIQIDNLQIASPDSLKEFIPSNIQTIKLERKPFSLKSLWLCNINILDKAEIMGLFNEDLNVDLKINLKNYPIILENKINKVKGLIELKTDELFKSPLSIKLKQVQITNYKFKLPLYINGGITLNKNNQIEAIQAPFEIRLGSLKITNYLLNSKQFKIHKTQIKELKPYIDNLPISDGFVEGDLNLDLKNYNKSLLNLKFDKLKVYSAELKQYIQGLKGNIKIFPLSFIQRIQNFTLKKNNKNNNNIQALFIFLGLEEFNLEIPNNNINISSASGSIEGKINYQKNKNLTGKLILNNWFFKLPKENIGIYKGNGIIDLVNEKANINLQAYNLYSLNNRREPLFIKGNLYLFPNQIADLKVFIPKFSFYKNNIFANNKSISNASINGSLHNIQAHIYFNKKLIIKKINGQIKDIYLKTNTKNIHLNDGNISLNEKQNLQIKNLQLNTANGSLKAQINLNLLSKKLEPIIDLNFKMPVQEIIDLIKIKLQYQINGLAEGHIKLHGKSLEKLNIAISEIEIINNNKTLIDSLKGKLFLSDNKQIILEDLMGNFNQVNKFKIYGQLNKSDYLPTLNINILLNPKNISEFLAKDKKPSLSFDEEIYLPASIQIKSLPNLKTDLHFSSNFHKMQLLNKQIHFIPTMSSLEYIIGHGIINWKTGNFDIDDLLYSDGNFGILLKALGDTRKFNFSIESAPLLDLKEIALLWSEDSASGQFRGNIKVKDFEPFNQKTWIRNLNAELKSEEDVHDFEYGILYGKHFSFDLNTIDGNGALKLTTQKGKIKNLQITNLNSEWRIENGLKAIIEKCSLETADGISEMSGNIDLADGMAELEGKMIGVNIEAVSNNLFNNMGSYNGKANLNYNLQGNFINMLKASSPQKANGNFELKAGKMKQIAELSKGLNLANLIFGIPIYFSFNTINHILQPQQDAQFLAIKGNWLFNKEEKKILLTDTIYTGINALHLSLNGQWDFDKKDLDFKVFGFIPKKPRTLGIQENYSMAELASKSRHFQFTVKGNIQNPNSITNSVKGSIKFIPSPSNSKMKEYFKI